MIYWKKQKVPSTITVVTYRTDSVYDFVLKLWENERHNDNGQQIRHLAAFYVDMTKQQAEEDENNKTHYKDEALSVLKLLTDKIDPIRKNYWNYLSKAIADI